MYYLVINLIRGGKDKRSHMIIGEREGVWMVPKYEYKIFEQPIRDQPPTFVTILPVTSCDKS